MVRGEFAAVHTPEQIMPRRGRPVGSTKQPVTLRVDSTALARLRATGKGWQTRASEALSQYALHQAGAKLRHSRSLADEGRH